MSNSYVRDLLINTYGNKCWLGGKVSHENPLTYHHIKPVRCGGRTTMNNGALLSLQKHAEFNVLESGFINQINNPPQLVLIEKKKEYIK